MVDVFLSCNWKNIMKDQDANSFCVYMFKWHKVSVANERMFRREGIFKFPDCRNVPKFAMDKGRKVLYTMSEHLNMPLNNVFHIHSGERKDRNLKQSSKMDRNLSNVTWINSTRWELK